MSTLHITLVGEQPEPIYYVIEELKPDAVVYVCSKQTESKAKAIQELACIEKYATVTIDPTDATEICKYADNIAETFSGDEISVNISGGSKPWAFIFGQRFSRLPNATILFLDQNNILWNYRTMKGHPIHYRFDLMKSLILRGNPLKEYHDFSIYTQKDAEEEREVERARRTNKNAFTELMSLLSSDQQNEIKMNDEGSFQLNKQGQLGPDNHVEWFRSDKEHEDALVRISLISKKGDVKEFEIESPHAIELAFNSGWFEFKIARLISSWDKVKKIYMNCVFPIKEQIAKNEVDIIIETDIKALFVECKTSVSRPNDIDKFRSVVKNYGGTSCTGILITEKPKFDDIQEKCNDNGIIYFSLSPYGGKMDLAGKDLRSILENQYRTINTR